MIEWRPHSLLAAINMAMVISANMHALFVALIFFNVLGPLIPYRFEWPTIAPH